MAGIEPVIDPNEAALALIQENGFRVFSPIKSSASQAAKQWTSNSETEGDLPGGSRPLNAEITLHVRITSPDEDGDEAAFRNAQTQFEQKINKLVDEGGTIRFNYPDGTWIDWEVRDVTGGERLLDNRFVHSKRTEDEITFVCAPFGEGEEELIGEFEFAGEAKRMLECIVEGIGGSAPALGRAVITSPEADVWDVKWSKESRRLSEAPTAKGLYAATALTPMGGATATVAFVEGQPNVPIVRQANLTPNWSAVLGTPIPGSGHMTHEGVLEVLLWVHMPSTNTGEVGIAFEYGVGDLLHRAELDPVYFPVDHSRENKVVQLVIGQIFLQGSGRGLHQWEGRVIARSTVTGDKLDVLNVGFRPLDEGSGRIAVNPSFRKPVALLTRDEFNQSAGNLNEKSLAAAGSISGPKYPTTAADDGVVGVVPWVTAGFAAGEPNGALAGVVAGGVSHYLKSGAPGFAIPGTATVTGIQVEILRHCIPGYTHIALGTGGNIGYSTTDNLVRLFKGGVPVGSNYAKTALFGNWPVTDAWASYGGPADLWGETWTPAQINAAGFGAGLSINNLGETVASQAYVDAFRITVFYDEAGGQKWQTLGGDPDDFTIDEVLHVAKRTAVSDADINTGRYALAGTTVLTDTVVGILVKRDPAPAPGSGDRIRGATLARFVNAENWLAFGAEVDSLGTAVNDTVRVLKRVGGSIFPLGKITVLDSSEYRAFYLHVDRRGRYFCWGALITSGLPRLLLSGQDSDLKEGGVLDDGRNGFYDAKTNATANTRLFDGFVAWIPPLDAAIYQGLSLELTDKTCRREIQGGGVWTDIEPEGDFLKLAPAGMENRKNRLVFIASPNNPDLMGVGFPSKLKVAIYAKPRYRTVPDPA